MNAEVGGKEEHEKQAETYLTDRLLNALTRSVRLLAYDLLLMLLPLAGLQPLMSVSSTSITLRCKVKVQQLRFVPCPFLKLLCCLPLRVGLLSRPPHVAPSRP